MSEMLKVGDEVIIRRGRYGSERTDVVTKVGRRWATIGEGRMAEQYDKETGYVNGKGYSPNARALTVEQWAIKDRRSGLVRRLDEATRSYGWKEHLTDEQIEAILAVIDDSTDESGLERSNLVGP